VCLQTIDRKIAELERQNLAELVSANGKTPKSKILREDVIAVSCYPIER